MKHFPRHAATPSRQNQPRRSIRFVALFAAVPLVLAASPASATMPAAKAPTHAVASSNLPSLVETAKRWWTAPVVGASCSSPFGQLRSDFGTYTHQGRDLLRYSGAPVRAVANGKVIKAGWSGGYRGGYGYRVVLKHGKGQITTLYGHMLRGSLRVHVGQWVVMGTVIGRMGSSGWSYGTHTHFEVRSWGTPINPDRFLRGKGVRLC